MNKPLPPSHQCFFRLDVDHLDSFDVSLAGAPRLLMRLTASTSVTGSAITKDRELVSPFRLHLKPWSPTSRRVMNRFSL